MLYIEVAPAIPLFGKNQVYTYKTKKKIPEGTIVSIPFGKRTVQGVVTSVSGKPPYPTKDVARVYAHALTLNQIAFGSRIARYAGGGLGFTLRLFFPPSVTAKKSSKGDIKTGDQKLIIVPERWMVTRFPKATIYHAGLPAKERAKIWHDVYNGKEITIVGTQKALFLPWQRLVSTTLHEAQLSTHKLWDQYPRLDNRRFLAMLAQQHGCDVVTETSFPSVQLWHENSKKYLNKAKLTYSVVPFSIDDRRKKFLLPQELVQDVYAWAKKKETILILHNQRESSVAKAMKALRLSRKNILINTTAVFTQVDDKKFDRVIWIYPERTFTFPDFRSRENGVLLLARLQGLLKSKRNVILATRYPEYIEQQLSEDPKKVFDDILAERKKFSYPPYTDMVRITFEDKDAKKVERTANAALTLLNKKLSTKKVRILGPYSPLARKNKPTTHKQHIVLFGKLDVLAKAYEGIKASSIDVDPQQIL